MPPDASLFSVRLKALREAAGFTQEELATIAGISIHAVSALERGQRRRPHPETVRALSVALDLSPSVRDELLGSARGRVRESVSDEPAMAVLPAPLTRFIGRDAEMHVLKQYLTDPQVRLVTLVGPGGAGKTRLATELVRLVIQQGTIRVAFASLAAIRDPALVGAAIAETFGWDELTGQDLPQRARAVWDGSSALLVLDNFEHLMEAAPMVADLLASVPALKIVVTSRAPLHVRGEREFSVGPLTLGAGAETMAPVDLARVAAVRLFVDRVRDVRPDFHLTPENGRTVASICRRLDSLPLALELAAPWLKVLTVDDLCRRLERGVALSVEGPRDLPQRQQTMNATVAWSYDLLDAREQRAFRRFGALPGLFPIDAAAAVLCGRENVVSAQNDALQAVAGLIDKSLLVRAGPSAVPTCTLYQMLETVRAFAASELEAAGEREDAMEGLVRYCLSEAALARTGLFGTAQIEWMDRVREDLQSTRAVLAWLLDAGRAEEACEIAYPLLFFWVIRGFVAEGQRWYERILSVSPLSRPVELRALVGAAVMRYAQGNLIEARTAIDRALEIANPSADQEAAWVATTFSAHIEHALGNGDTARQRFAESLKGFQELGVAWGIGHTLSGLAWVALTDDEYERAECLLDESRLALVSAGPWFLTLGLHLRSVLAIRRGKPDDAIAVIRESLERVRLYKDTFAYMYALVTLATAAGLRGDDLWVARLVGVRDAVRDLTGTRVVDTLIKDLYQQTERDARARLGTGRWAKAHAEGRKATVDSLLKDIDAVRARPTRP